MGLIAIVTLKFLNVRVSVEWYARMCQQVTVYEYLHVHECVCVFECVCVRVSICVCVCSSTGVCELCDQNFKGDYTKFIACENQKNLHQDATITSHSMLFHICY